MFLHRSLQWPSTPAFLSKFFHTTTTSPKPFGPSQKPRSWRFPIISLSTLPSLLAYLPSLKTDGATNSPPQSHISAQHFQICINLVHHILEMCTLGCLWVFSPVFRVTLDVLGIRGAIKLWIHGLAIFLATTYGMYFLLWLAQEYLLHLASLYGILQTLVLTVSLRADRYEEMAEREVRTEELEESGGERELKEDRWAGGSEDEGGNSDDVWESEGDEEVGTD
ncbi:hypothetical protein GDO86_015635 [Hymenochirus boettgeri]|uniref:Uncharacterized protein n=1 Tax=Hymenochirus boettgeri TaxID=247094 RepID=A0A8T2JYP0_9PIPI|nr:hypothetical protein GDO86_015635 [Hymenochirus boettgeri]